MLCVKMMVYDIVIDSLEMAFCNELLFAVKVVSVSRVRLIHQ